MKKLGFSVTGAAGLLAFLLSFPALALPICTNGTTVLAGGIGSVTAADLGAGECVQTGDKLWGDFTFDADFTSALTINFNSLTLAGQDHHQISFNDNYTANGTYDLNFEVAVLSTRTIIQLDGDFTQAASTGVNSQLTKNSNPTGIPVAGINLFKTGTTAVGTGIIVYSPGVVDLIITEQLQIHEGAVSSITDTIIQSGTAQAPEPASLALVGLGLSALGLMRRRRKAS